MAALVKDQITIVALILQQRGEIDQGHMHLALYPTKTRTCPELAPSSELNGAPPATVRPLAESATE